MSDKVETNTNNIEIKELAYLTTINQLSDENNRLRNRVNYLELLIVELNQAMKKEEEVDVSSNG